MREGSWQGSRHSWWAAVRPAGLAIASLVASQTVSAQDEGPFCRIAAPEVRQEGGLPALEVRLECSNQLGEGLLRYPEQGPLYLGVSLFVSDDARGEETTLEAGDVTDLPFVTLDGAVASRSVSISLDQATPEAAHYVVALWTTLMDCIYCDAEHGLGPVDEDLFPMPLDTYPRPICDLTSLEEIGYFDWSETGDPSGFQAPSEIRDIFGQVNCYRRDESMPGLGLSLKSWRTAPLPASAASPGR